MVPITNNSASFAATLLVLAAASSTLAHSWLECTDWDRSSNTCRGYQRGWNAQHVDTEMTYRILNREDVPACFPGKQDSPDRYTDRFPMARVRPGQTLTFTYLENGHTTKDRLPGRPNPKSYSVHWSPQAGQDTIRRRADLTAKNRLGRDQPFDDGQCSEDGAQPGREKRPCRGAVTVPSDATPGRHQLVWWWRFDRAGPEEYTACFDVLVEGDAGEGRGISKRDRQLAGEDGLPGKSRSAEASTPDIEQVQPADDETDSKEEKVPERASLTEEPLRADKSENSIKIEESSGASVQSSDNKCAGTSFDPSVHVCDHGQLCPLKHKACGKACYSPDQYTCRNDQLDLLSSRQRRRRRRRRSFA